MAVRRRSDAKHPLKPALPTADRDRRIASRITCATMLLGGPSQRACRLRHCGIRRRQRTTSGFLEEDPLGSSAALRQAAQRFRSPPALPWRIAFGDQTVRKKLCTAAVWSTLYPTGIGSRAGSGIGSDLCHPRAYCSGKPVSDPSLVGRLACYQPGLIGRAASFRAAASRSP